MKSRPRCRHRLARPHLHEPRPDRRGRRVDRDRAGRDHLGVLQQLISRDRRFDLIRGRAPIEDPRPAELQVSDREQHEAGKPTPPVVASVRDRC
jgi:hypothetical protein